MIAINAIAYIYQSDPKNPTVKPAPPDTEAARKHLKTAIGSSPSFI